MSISKRNYYKKLQSQDSSIPHILYIIKHLSKPIVKIGITKDLNRRTKDISKAFGTSEVLFSIEGKYKEVSLLESDLHESFKEHCKVQPKGYGKTEWFCASITKDILSFLKEFV